MSKRSVLQTAAFMMVFVAGLATTQAATGWDATTDFSSTSNTATDTWQYLRVQEGVNTGYSLLPQYSAVGEVGWISGWNPGNSAPFIGAPNVSSLYVLPHAGTSAVIGWKSPLEGPATVSYSFSITALTAGPDSARTYALFKEGDGTALNSGSLAVGGSTGTITGKTSIANGQMLYLQLGPNGVGTSYYGDDSRVTFRVEFSEPATLTIF